MRARRKERLLAATGTQRCVRNEKYTKNNTHMFVCVHRFGATTVCRQNDAPRVYMVCVYTKFGAWARSGRASGDRVSFRGSFRPVDCCVSTQHGFTKVSLSPRPCSTRWMPPLVMRMLSLMRPMSGTRAVTTSCAHHTPNSDEPRREGGRVVRTKTALKSRLEFVVRAEQAQAT